MQMDALRSWWEIPSIAHFCSLFRAAFQLPDFDIEDLEDGFLAAASEEGSPFLEDLFCRLLQGCYGRDDIEPYNFEIYLNDIMKGLAVELKIENPLEGRRFRDIGLRQKVEILQHLCDSRLDSLDVMDQLKGFEGDNMRVEALGKDSTGATYWYFYGSRLYKEDAEPVIEEPIKEKKVRKKTKEKDKKTKGKSKKRGRKSGRTAKTKTKQETKQATRTSSRTSTRVSSRLRALEEQNFEDEEEGEGEDSNEDEEDEEEEMKTEDVNETKDVKETDETKKEIKEEEDVAEESENRLDMKGEKEEDGDKCEIKAEEQDVKEESESQNHDGDIVMKDDDDSRESISEDIATKTEQEPKNENPDSAMETGNNDVKEETELEGNTNENNSNKPVASLGLPLPEVNPRWHLICKNFEDWDALAESFKESKIKCERDLCRCITQDFLPAIPEIMEAREKERKKRLLEAVPKRASSRISLKRKELEEQEAILAEAEAEEEKQRKLEEEEKRKLLEIEKEEEEKRLREERQRNREERAKRLEQREQRAQLIAEGKEIPPELQYTASSYNSKYREEEDNVGQHPELDDEDIEEMEKVLETVKNHKDAWPFMEPVDEEVAPGYHDIIKKPMDLSLIEKRLKNRSYKSKRRFVKDFNLMCENCRHYNGIESDLGLMAQKLQRCVNKAVRFHMDKVKDNYEADEEFRITQAVRAEKKYRPKRAASSRAMDTLHRAMNYDDDFEQYNSDEDSDRSQSPKPYRDKIVRLDPPTPTKSSRLIPELSPNIDEIGWSGEQKTIRQINKVGNPEWNIDGNVVSFNGKKLLYNFSKQNRQTSATSLSLLDAKKYSPYSNKHETSSSSSTEKMELKDTAFHQGQKFVFQVKRKPGKPNASGTSLLNDNSLLSPKRPLSPKGPGVSNSQMKQLGPAGMGQVRQLNVGPVGVSKVRQMSQAGQPQMIAKHGQSGGTVKIGTTPTSTGSPRLPMAVNSVSPTGQRIIKIVAAPGQQPLQPGQVINLAELGLVGGANKAIKISGNVLQVKGQSTGFPLSGKTRIIYQGSTSASKIAAVSSTATSVTPTETQTLLAGSISATGTEQQKQAIITLGPSSGLSPLSPNTSVQVDGKSAQEGIIKRSVESSVLQAAQEKSFVGSNNMQAPLENSKSLSGSLTPESKNIASDSPVKTVLPVKTNVPNTSSVITSGDRSPGSDRSNSSDEDIPELFPMNPPQQPPKKRKVSDGSSTSLSPSKVFIQGVSSSPPSVKSHSPPKLPVASHSPKSQVASHSLNSPMVSHSAKLPLAGLSKMNSPPKLTPQSLLGPPKLTCPPRIRSPPKSSGPPKLTPVIPLDSSNGTHSEWKQNTNSKFPPYTPHQTNGPSESRKSVFDAFDMDDSPMQDTGSEHSAKQETNSGNVTKLICDSDDKTEDSVTMDDMLNDTELSRTSSLAVHNSDSVSHSTENRLQEHELESKVDTGKKSPDKGNLFDNFATFLHTPPTIPSQPTSQPTDHNLFNSQSTSLSTSHSSSSQSSSSLSSLSSPFATSQTSSSHYSGRSIFDSISPVSNASHQNNTHPVNISQSEVIGGQKQSLTQNMMDKVSAFAANLHTGSLASRLGNLSPSKSLPMATSLHQSSPVTQGTVNREHISSPVVQQYRIMGDHPRGPHPSPQGRVYHPQQGAFSPMPPGYYQRPTVIMSTEPRQFYSYGQYGLQYYTIDPDQAGQEDT